MIAGSAPGSSTLRQIVRSLAMKLVDISMSDGSTCRTPARALTISIGIAKTTTSSTRDASVKPSAMRKIGMSAAVGVTSMMLI